MMLSAHVTKKENMDKQRNPTGDKVSLFLYNAVLRVNSYN